MSLRSRVAGIFKHKLVEPEPPPVLLVSTELSPEVAGRMNEALAKHDASTRLARRSVVQGQETVSDAAARLSVAGLSAESEHLRAVSAEVLRRQRELLGITE
jgi:hypothetical protein